MLPLDDILLVLLVLEQSACVTLIKHSPYSNVNYRRIKLNERNLEYRVERV